MDDIKVECIFNEQVPVKEEEDNIKEEPEWEDNAGLHGISAAAARAGLYANHEVKDELVLGPVGVQPADIAFTLYACQASAARAQPVLRDCVARPERLVASNADVGNQVHSNASIHTEKQTYVCDICNKRFALKTRLMEHVMVHIHQEPEQEERRLVVNAAKALAVKKQHKLRDCVVRLERIDAPAPLSIQQLHVHPGTEQEDKVPARAGGRGETRGRGSAGEHGHCCRTCNNTFTKLSLLKRHERTHTGERPYSCGTCNKKFTQLSCLKRHERTHTGEKPFSCRTCNKKFMQLGNLKAHERIHTGERPFSCGICKRKFTTSSHFKYHERIHTGERPFSCGICKRKFTTSSHLKNHERIHTEEKPFSCAICNKKFTQLSSLKNHERIHTGEKPLACDVCKKLFTQFRSLTDHKDRFHADRKPFCCDICQKRFAQKTSLVGHIRRHRTAKPR